MSVVAGIDCGTNSIRLLIAEISDGVLTDVHRTMEVVRLGEGVDRTGRLSEAALTRTFAACDLYAPLIAQADVAGIRFVATSATRDASNRDEFFDGVEHRLGVVPEVISGDTEAELSFIGATRSLGSALGDQPILVVDIGGGSTECVLGSVGGGVSSASSVDVGCVRMTERWLRDDPPTAEQVAGATLDIDKALAQAAQQVDFTAATKLVGLAGSVTTIAAIALDLNEYDADATHGSIISRGRVDEITAELMKATREQRAAIAVMHPGRVDVIAGGALVLDRLLHAMPHISEVVVSEHDILDGICWSLALG